MRNRLKGITLVETLVYLGVFSIIIIMILNFTLTTQESTLKTEREGGLHQSIQFVVQHIDDTFDAIDSVNQELSIFESDTSELHLLISTEPKIYTLENGRLYFDTIPITPSSVVVEKFRVIPIYQGQASIIGTNIEILMSSKADMSIKEDLNMLFTIR